MILINIVQISIQSNKEVLYICLISSRDQHSFFFSIANVYINKISGANRLSLEKISSYAKLALAMIEQYFLQSINLTLAKNFKKYPR